MEIPRHNYYIKCEECNELIAQADNIQKLLEILFKELAYHNLTHEEICSMAKKELSMDDLRGAFASEMWRVYKATEHEENPVEWALVTEDE